MSRLSNEIALTQEAARQETLIEIVDLLLELAETDESEDQS